MMVGSEGVQSGQSPARVGPVGQRRHRVDRPLYFAVSVTRRRSVMVAARTRTRLEVSTRRHIAYTLVVACAGKFVALKNTTYTDVRVFGT